jgi:vitamin B12 transporter
LREVVVTATRNETDPDTTGTSLTVVGADEIAAAHYANVSDALRSVPGLDLATPGTAGQVTGVFTRGTNSNQTIVTLDGRRLPFDLAGTYDLTNLTLDNVERIEVLRGPSSSVYGSNALGGVINLISKNGRDLAKPTASVLFEGGSFGTYREAMSAAGAEKGIDYSVEGSRVDTDNQRPNSQYRNTTANGKVGWQAAPGLYFDTTFRYALSDAGSPNVITKPDPEASFLKETWSLSPGVTWKTADDWTQKLFYAHTQQRSVSDHVTALFETNYRSQVNSDQVDYQSEIDVLSNLKLTVGGSFEDYRITRFNDDLGVRDVSQAETRLGGFVQTQWEALKNWNWTANVRFDHHSDFGNFVTFRVGQAYRIPGVETLLRANYGTAFAPPSPQDTAAAFFGDPHASVQKSKGYELGLEQPLLKGRLVVGSTWFHNNIRNLPDFDLNTFTLTYIGRAMTEGVENYVEITPLDALKLKFGYTYLTAEDTVNHLRLVRRPRHHLNADASWQPVSAVTLTGGLQWVVAREDYYPAQNNPADVEDYTRVRFTAAWDVKKWLQIFGRVENVLGEKYAEAYGFPALDAAVYAGFKLTY